MTLPHRIRSQDGFTFFEVIAVCLILGILAALTYVIFTGQDRSALDMDAKSNARNMVSQIAACYEEMNYSLFGPAVFNCAAPDDGNMTVLNKVGTERQKTRWLQPIVDGTVRLANLKSGGRCSREIFLHVRLL